MGNLLDKIRKGERALGTHISINDCSITELIGNVGYDYLWIDTEHTTIDLDHLQQHLIAARAAGVSVIVRIPSIDPVRAKPVLEMGPDGIVFPMIRSYDDAKLAVASCMYPPKGIRGFGPRRAVQYGRVPMEEYIHTVDDNLLKILQIEHIDAVNDLDNILTIDYIGAFIIGPRDLSASMGLLNDMYNPAVLKMIDDIIARVKKAGKKIGLSVGACKDEVLISWFRSGIDMISMGSDLRYLLGGAESNLMHLKKISSMK